MYMKILNFDSKLLAQLLKPQITTRNKCITPPSYSLLWHIPTLKTETVIYKTVCSILTIGKLTLYYF